MPSSRLRRTTIACVLALALPALSSCASSHLLEWSRGEPSVFAQSESEEVQSVVRPGGTVVALEDSMTGLNPSGAPNRESFVRIRADFDYDNDVEAALGPFATIDSFTITVRFND